MAPSRQGGLIAAWAACARGAPSLAFGGERFQRWADRDGVQLTNLDQPLFEGAGATKRDLVEYLDGVRELILPELEDRPLSVIRVHRGQEAFI